MAGNQGKGAIFDLDGTLLDSMGVWDQVDIDFLSKRGIDVPDDYMTKVAAMQFRQIAEYTIARFSLTDTPEELMDEWDHMARVMYATVVEAKPYAREYLAQLKESGAKLAVATSLPPMLREPAMKHVGIFDYFDEVVSVDDAGDVGKDQPDVYLLAASHLGVEPGECTVFYHELTWESLLQTLRDSVKDITVITIILAFSGVFGYGIVFDNITVTIANALLGITSNSAILLLLVVVFLLICGMFMETTVIALILTPILLPVMRSIGVNEVVFGMIMMTTVTFGVMTPPVGTALYAVSDIMECPIEETFKKGWPFYLAIVCVILFMIFFPQAVLFLPNLVYGA
mgnify:CR=1 FL=1